MREKEIYFDVICIVKKLRMATTLDNPVWFFANEIITSFACVAFYRKHKNVQQEIKKIY